MGYAPSTLATHPERRPDDDPGRSAGSSAFQYELEHCERLRPSHPARRCRDATSARSGGHGPALRYGSSDGDHARGQRPKRLICTGVCDLARVTDPTNSQRVLTARVGESCVCKKGHYLEQGDPARILEANFLEQDEEWKERASCREVDPELFFPKKGQAYKVYDIQRICVQCPVFRECKDYRERTNTTDGVWAGQIWRLGKTN